MLNDWVTLGSHDFTKRLQSLSLVEMPILHPPLLQANHLSMNEENVRMMIYLDEEDWTIQSHSDYPTRICRNCQ